MQAPETGTVLPAKQNRFFYNSKGIRSGWRLLAWLGLSFVGVVCVAIGFVVIALVSGMSRTHGANMPVWVLMSFDWLIFVPVFLAAVFVAIVMEKRPVRSLGFGFHSRWISEMGIGLAWGAGLMSVLMVILVSVGAYRIGGFNDGAVSALGWGLLMAIGFIGVATFEEFLFRGYLLQNLIDGLGLPAAAVISCLVFAATHISNSGENLLGVLDVLLAGILLFVLIVRTRSLWMALGLHAAWDWAQNFIYGVADSGTILPGGLLKSAPHGADWLTGGKVGPEGSVIALLINGLAILYFARARWVVPTRDAAELWARFVWPREVEVAPAFVPEIPPLPDFSLPNDGE